ncbi:MAG: NAD-dependent deacylase [Bacteroidia bacterium]|nr:NAD-dependent deacylase [Bacteroidia bacterium]
MVLTGAGISAESGLSTFRDSGGLWEKYSIYEVATPEAWQRDPQLVLDFYNERRSQLREVKPNPAHTLLRELEKSFTVIILTQNVDDLHERAGSTYILHLHGELTKARSTVDDSLVYEIGYQPIRLGDKCEKGSQLRPHVVWFGEEVPAYPIAQRWAEQADIFVVIGSSLQVYPAAGLVEDAYRAKRKLLIDPRPTATHGIEVIQAPASQGVAELIDRLTAGT